jgi:hypothetical protein
MTVSINGTSGIVFNDASAQNTATKYGMVNRIINGAMMIDQRNAGASVTPINGQYTLDRWVASLAQTSKFSVQQNAGSVTPPTGFTNYLGVTSLSAYSVLAGDYFSVQQKIEGFNSSDLGWGTANANTITISFQVRSSLTGTFGGSIINSNATRSYPFTYSIPVANTWTSISVTIAGDTSGTWLTTNGIGINIMFGLGAGSTFSGTAGAWASANYASATGATSVVGTNGATFYITGVQLEKGSTATSFDYRPYGTELALCQRYFYRNVIAYSGVVGGGSGTVPFGGYSLPVTMRASPTAVWNSGGTIDNGSSGFSITSLNIFTGVSPAGGYLGFNIGSNATIGRGCAIYNVDASFSSEL